MAKASAGKIDVKTDSFAVVVFAAGAASRFGTCKLTAELKGKPIIRHSLDPIEKMFDHCYVVLGCHRSLIEPHLKSAKKIVNEQWQSGLSSSIAKACDQLEQYIGILIVLADQFKLTSSFLIEIKSHILNSPSTIIATEYGQDTFGPPVYFPRRYFAELKEKTSENGAKYLLAKYHDQVIWLNYPDARFDIDYPKDLKSAEGTQ